MYNIGTQKPCEPQKKSRSISEQQDASITANSGEATFSIVIFSSNIFVREGHLTTEVLYS